jgi:acyl-CoA reductase-like NAD-dependent aldehyde dehydrogenase
MTMVEELEPEVSSALSGARAAQALWSGQSFAERRQYFRQIRAWIAGESVSLAESVAGINGRPRDEKLVSEVLPLADTCHWLEKRAETVLRPRASGRRDRPLWLRGMSFLVHRQPWGVILVIGPANYPLFIPGGQVLHALAAGNAVLLKPAPGTEPVAEAFARTVWRTSLDRRLLQILPAEPESATAAIRVGVDKIVFSGSSENGRTILGEAAALNIPAIAELSGEDPLVVFGDADLDLVMRALRFGTRWNDGDTCMAPRRIVVVESVAPELRRRLVAAPEVADLPIAVVPEEVSAVREAMTSPFGLGASIFSRDVSRAKALAAKIKTGFVFINDLVVPAADPRLPFGGVKASGFGVVRGEEGLLEMTFPHVIAVRKGQFQPHLDELAEDASTLFASYLQAAHGQGWQRRKGLADLVRALIREMRKRAKK